MKYNRRAVLLAAAVGATSAGCARQAPLYTAANVPFGGEATERERSLQIRRAGTGLGWVMEDAAPGLVRGTLELRTHKASVEVPYDRQRFSINHVLSRNLDFNGSTIHSNYNGWVRRLEQMIVAQSNV